MVNYNSVDWVTRLLGSFDFSRHRSSYFFIINNSPLDQVNLKKLEGEQVTIIEVGYNSGFGRACNLGLTRIYDQFPNGLVWLLNPDTCLSPSIINQASSFFNQYPEISILGTLIYSKDQKIWFGGGRFNRNTGEIFSQNLFTSSSPKPYYVCDWVSGCSMIINFKHFQKCPQFDPNYFLYYEDFDFCQRYQSQGHLVAVTDYISVIHEVSAITNRNLRSKFYHSTYSYLFTLERYTAKPVFYLRFLRLIIYAFILLPVKPAIALGKITGAWHYIRKSVSGVLPFTH